MQVCTKIRVYKMSACVQRIIIKYIYIHGYIHTLTHSLKHAGMHALTHTHMDTHRHESIIFKKSVV